VTGKVFENSVFNIYGTQSYAPIKSMKEVGMHSHSFLMGWARERRRKGGEEEGGKL
jgi:hypothetical protein